MKLRYIFVCSLMFILSLPHSKINAQNVNIELKNTGSVLEVWLTPKAAYSGFITSLNFTISWDAAYNVDLLKTGSEIVHMSSIPLQVAGNVAKTTLTNGGRKYRVYSSSGGSNKITLTPNAAFKVMSIAVPKTSYVPVGQFSISNDAFTTGKNFNYYFEITGIDYTGTTTSSATTVDILPLELVSFKGVEQNNSAYLTWKTANEINFSHFEVERSTDAKTWSSISEIKGGNREGVYSLADEKAFAESNIVLYRLKMVNQDATFKYSNVVSLEHKALANKPIKIFPNPTRDNLQLIIDAPKDAVQTVDIMDISGKIWLHTTINVQKGQNQQSIDIRDLPSGTYFLSTLTDKKVKEVLQFVKL
jgi:hypothetical protein